MGSDWLGTPICGKSSVATETVTLINSTIELHCEVGTSGLVHANLSSVNEPHISWACQYCEREFGTKIGLGVHKSHAHRESLDEEYSRNSGNSSRKRWTHEEDLALAKRVIELQGGNAVLSNTEISRKLVGEMHGRSAEAIRARLKTATCKKVLVGVTESAYCSYDSDSNFVCTQEPISQQTLVENVDEVNSQIDGEQAPLISTRINSELRAELKSAAREQLGKISNVISIADKYKIRHLSRILHLPRGDHRVSAKLSAWLVAITAPGRIGKGVTQRSKRKFVCDGGVIRGREGCIEHAYIQNLYKKRGATGVARYVFQDKGDQMTCTEDDESTSVGANEMLESWTSTFMGSNDAERTITYDKSYECDSATREIMVPITMDDIRQSELKSHTAPGLDGLKASQWKIVPRSVRSALYNIILYHGVVLDSLAKARTTFIPKVPEPRKPGEFRPISITSVIQRQLHKILGHRLNILCKTSRCQVGFKNIDGVAVNVSTIRTVIEHSKNNFKDLHMVAIDLRKAFDSVSHKSIVETCLSRRLPVEFVEYVETLYSKAVTQLQFEGESRDITIGQGTFQGDPLSPVLFNLVIDNALESMDDRFGYLLDNGSRAKCTAYADDVIILGSTKTGVQLNINTLANQLALVGLQINPEKCMSLSLVADRKRKRSGLDTSGLFTAPVEDSTHQIKPIRHTTEWKYLGVKFCGAQLVKHLPEIRPYLQRLDNAKLTPQQKLEILNSNVISKWVHIATLSNASREELSLIDKAVREYVRKWLHLPHDVPKAYIHAPTRVGGVGVFELAIRIPVSRAKRLEGIVKRHFIGPSLRNSQFAWQIKGTKDSIYNEHGVVADDGDPLGTIYSKQLESKWATQGLTSSSECVASRSWVRSEANGVSPYDYISYHLISSNSLATRARRNWGRRLNVPNVECRAGCDGKAESIHHILQECVTTHGMRVRRHNRIVDLVCSALNRLGRNRVIKEPQFETKYGMRKPDLVIVAQNGHAHVVDVQVCGRYDLKRKNTEKSTKYAAIPGLKDLVRGRYNAKKVSFHAITIAYTGIILGVSADLLIKKLRLSKKLLHILSTSVLRGSYIQWRIFNKRFRCDD